MVDRRIIAVTGATGAQGGGLVRALLSDPAQQFAVRAITRNVKSDQAMQLRESGAEVVAGDLDNLASLKDAFAGAYGAYCVTFFWEHFSPAKELAQIQNMAHAAREARMRHVIWSTLEDTRRWVPLRDNRMPTLMERYKVPHFDAKGEGDAIFAEVDVPTTCLWTSFYWDNLIHFGMGPKIGQSGKLEFVLPMADKKLPGIASEDIGRCALGVFRSPDEYLGRTVGIAGEHLTGEQMAAELSVALGREVVYTYVPPEVYRGLGFPGAADLGNMFQFKRDFESVFCGHRDLATSRRLNPELQTFAQWLARNKERIPL
ncbi:MAG: NmrA/HSCARG family protein [Candidatus Schekmanbacteria bacterium]|nr:NmrA/HSCARG family protein [Candidatus Schekmanbacteria bacterium]